MQGDSDEFSREGLRIASRRGALHVHHRKSNQVQPHSRGDRSFASLSLVSAICVCDRTPICFDHIHRARTPDGNLHSREAAVVRRYRKECREHAQEKLDRYSTQIKGPSVEVQTLLAEGDVGIVIPEWIRQHHLDLIAVGTTGRSGVRKLFLGSTAEEIIRTADCPVLTVGRAFSGHRSVAFRCVLCAIDFSEDSLLAASYALSLAVHHDARLILLTVIDRKAEHESKSSFAQRLNELISNETKPACELEILVASGNPAKRILEISNEHFVDLIALGVRGAGGLARAASHFGSTAHDIIVGSSCPVLTVRASK